MATIICNQTNDPIIKKIADYFRIDGEISTIETDLRDNSLTVQYYQEIDDNVIHGELRIMLVQGFWEDF